MLQSQYLEEIILILEKFLAKFGGKAIPCTKEEVEVLESMLPHPYRLPAAYKEFLLYGGKTIKHWFGYINSYYRSAKVLLEDDYQYIIHQLSIKGSKSLLPKDIFVICEHRNCYFNYLLLTEGDNPPVYLWEKSKGGLEASEKIQDSFSDYLREKISIAASFWNFWFIINNSEKSPRGQQFWVSRPRDLREGIISFNLMDRLGFDPAKKLAEAAALTGLDRDSYLEELSGWKCRKLTENDNEVRFFPPET